MEREKQGRPKPKMTETDVEAEMGRFFQQNFGSLDLCGKIIPESVHDVTATIQPTFRKFEGVGEYLVHFDMFGRVKDGDNGYKENERFGSLCKVIVKSDNEDSPIIEIKDTVSLNKR